MSFSINRITIMGHVGQSPELKYTPKGTAVISFSVAVNRKWKDAAGNETEAVDWFNVEAWGKTAEYLGENLLKGMRVFVDGDMRSREYENKEGKKVKVWTITGLTVIPIPKAAGAPTREAQADTTNAAPGAGDGDLPF